MTKILDKCFVFVLLFFIFFTFYDLNWGSPYYFHPDERNIASAVTRLSIDNLNPEFFAYGSFPIYTTYLTGLINNFLSSPFSFSDFSVNFEEAIIIGRIFSSMLSVLTIGLIYLLTKRVSEANRAKFALTLGALSVGYLQYSHFGTFEMWLSFFYLLLTYLTILAVEKRGKYFIFMSLIFGICMAIKVSSITLFIVPLIAIVKLSFSEKRAVKKVIAFFAYIVAFAYITLVVFIITNPFVILDFKSFIGSMNYETSVATGILPVFYTGSFINTLPFLYQLEKVLPFLINPLLTLLFIPATSYLVYKFLKTKNFFLLIILVSFLSIFISQSILFVKWTRYIVPAISYIFIFIALSVFDIRKLIPVKVFNLLIVLILIASSVFAFSFIKTVRLSKDTRVEAAEFSKEIISANSRVISEVYDMGIVPFNQNLPNISLFNFYDLDETSLKQNELNLELENADYIILPSQRVLKSRTEKKFEFPIGYNFYNDLISNSSDFKEIYKTPCDIFCKILYLGDPIFKLEETSNIFDRPEVRIYKK